MLKYETKNWSWKLNDIQLPFRFIRMFALFVIKNKHLGIYLWSFVILTVIGFSENKNIKNFGIYVKSTVSFMWPIKFIALFRTMTNLPVPVTVLLKLDISILECEKMLCHFFSTSAGVLLSPTTVAYNFCASSPPCSSLHIGR